MHEYSCEYCHKRMLYQDRNRLCMILNMLSLDVSASVPLSVHLALFSNGLCIGETNLWSEVVHDLPHAPYDLS